MRLTICVAAWLIATGFIAAERVSAQRAADAAPAAGNPGLLGVRGDERRVLEYLLHDWNSDSAITSVDVAMDALKVRPSDELRFRIGSHIKAHPELHATVRKWGWETIVLTPNEKLVARGIVNPERDKQTSPSKADLAKTVGISERDVNRAVEMLARYDILKIDQSVGGIGYVATKPRYTNWPQWLDFQFHRVSLASGRTFCVD